MGLLGDAWDAVKDAGGKLTGALSQAWNTACEALNRAFGFIEFILSLLGIRIPKQLRLRVVILRGPTGPVLSEADALPAIDLAKKVFEEECQTMIRAGRHPLISTPNEVAPAEALDVGCQFDAWKEDFGTAGQYFRKYSTSVSLLGYGSPVTVFVVQNVNGENGCSLGPVVDYVTVDVDGMTSPGPRTLPHELAHACGLWHVGNKANLMKAGGSGTELVALQEAVVRNSRHVTIF